MAITSSSQVLDADKVYMATAYLNDAINYLKAAQEKLKTAKIYSSKEVFETNMGNPIPERTEALITYLGERINDISNLKAKVEAKARSIESSEQAEYRNYLAEQEAKKAEEAKKASEAKNVPYNSSNAPKYNTLPSDKNYNSQVVYL